MVKTVTALRRLEPNGEVIKLSATSSTEGSLLQKLLVKEGDRLKAGQVIAIIDSCDCLQASLVEAGGEEKLFLREELLNNNPLSSRASPASRAYPNRIGF
ncbi:biotin/lipoyl-binding protein [Nostoc sp.]|uniref:biotin/lipoyl-binding protein n=1 Tax=Nostoc sp. TaxID=1180 RepID=UPI002FFD34A0